MLMEIADTVAARIGDRLSWLSDAFEDVVVVPVLVLLVYWALRLLVQLVLPRIATVVFDRVMPAVGHLVAVVVLSSEFLVAQGFRLAGAQPPALLYGFGTTTVAADGVWESANHDIARRARALRRFRRLLLLIAAGYLVHRWSLGFCARNPAAACAPPVDLWWAKVQVLPDHLGL
jgi:hypothetical protein